MTDRSNREIVEEFAEIFYHQRDVKRAFELYVSADRYVQHNPTIPDGRDAAVESLAPKFGHPNAHFEIKKIIVEGDLAVVHVRAFPTGGKEAAVADFFRLENGKIVEHWDVLQLVPETSVNDNTMF